MSSTHAPDRARLSFGLMFFAANEGAHGESRYRLIVESAHFADREGLSSIWVPERHFTEFGGLYPSPSVLHAALARETSRVGLRAGSVVIPLNSPLRTAEEWSMVDNLSGGRAGVSAASGWNPDDFSLAPAAYENRREELYRGLEQVQRLWRGEKIEVVNGVGETVELGIYPRPVQEELPIWITAAGNPATFVRAGELGANVLTHLLDHDLEDIAERIALYREARERNGHDPEAGEVTIMLHTFLGEDPDSVRDLVRDPYCDWLKGNAGLLRGLAANRDEQIDLDALSEEDLDGFVGFLFDRFFQSRSLMGTPETCLELVGNLHGAGVTEIACLLDFGPSDDLVLEHLPHLVRLQELYRLEGRAEVSLAAAARERAVEHPVWEAAEPAPPATLEAIRERCDEELEVEAFYADLRRFGADFGERFQGVESLRRRDGEALAAIRLRPPLRRPDGEAGLAHPAFLDACFQVIAAALPTAVVDDAGDALFLPTGLGSFARHAPLPERLWSHSRLRPGQGDDGTFVGDIRLVTDDEEVVAEVEDFRLQRTTPMAEAPAADPVGEGLYQIDWVEVDAPSGDEVAGSWLLLADQRGVAEALVGELAERGATSHLVRPGERGRDEAGTYRIDPASPDDAGWLLDEVREETGAPPAGIVHLWSLDAHDAAETTLETLAEDEERVLGSLLHLIQAVPEGGSEAPTLWLLSRGAQQAAGDDPAPEPVGSLLWGFGTTVAVERPELFGAMVDLEACGDPRELAARLAGLLAADGEDNRLALRGTDVLAPRVRRQAPGEPEEELEPGEGTWLVTGGLGGIGLATARWLADKGAGHLLLLGRTPLPPRESWQELDPDSREGERTRAVLELEAAGAAVRTAAVDIADPEELEAALGGLETEGWPPVRGVFHAAGIGHAEKLEALDLATLREILRPKVEGSWVLHERFSGEETEAFVLFSSATHQVGILGQGVAAYSAANAFLDGLAVHRAAGGASALSVAWGPWTEVGLAARSGNDERLRGFGIDPVPPERGFAALDRLLVRDRPLAWALWADWERLAQADPDLTRATWLSEVLAEASLGPEAEAEAARRAELLEALAQAPPRARRQRIVRLIQEQTAAVMSAGSADDVDWSRGLFDLGIDSLMALELKNRLQGLLGLDIPATLVFDYPTVEAMGAYLTEALFPGGDEAEQGEASEVELDDLSEEEMEERLLEKLESL